LKLFSGNNKKIAAVCWLMLMLVVHGVKLLHNHANRIDLLTCHAENNAAHSCASVAEDHGEKDCSVCEYKLNKDNDVFRINFFTTPSFIDIIHSENKCSLVYSYLANTENKGPPVKA
jgi:hypothetical protein